MPITERARTPFRGGLLATSLTYVALGFWSLVCAVPLYWAIVASIKPPIEFVIGPHYLPFVDFQPSLHAWRQILADRSDDTLPRFFNSLVVASAATMFTVLIGTAAAYALTRWRLALAYGRAGILLGVTVAAGLAILAGMRVSWIAGGWIIIAVPLVVRARQSKQNRGISSQGLFAIIVAARILPPLVTVMPLYYLFQKAGIYDARAGLTLAYTAANLPISVWLMRGFLRDLSRDVEEAAQLDGASRWRAFFTMVLPACKPAIVAASAIVFLLCWNEYIISAYLTADHAMTLPPFLAGQMTTREQMAAAEPDDYARLAVVVVLMLLPAIALTSAFQRIVARISR